MHFRGSELMVYWINNRKSMIYKVGVVNKVEIKIISLY